MIWLTWRQHRTEGLVTLGVLALSGAFLLITGLAMAHDLQHSGLGACLAHHPDYNGPGPCDALGRLFVNQYSSFTPFAVALLLLPVFLGVLVGGPLVAREYEQRTHLLVWMQSITRSRWLTVKLALVLGAGLLASGALLAMLIRWYAPFDQLVGKFNPLAFDFSGPVLIAATVMALAVGIAAGAVTRRTISAILLTLALLVAIHVLVEFNLRANYEPQVVVTWPLDLSGQGLNPPITLGREDWRIGSGWLDSQGNRTNMIRCIGANPEANPVSPDQCAKDDGYRGNYLAYQPAGRFWTFQWIETGIYLVISALAVAVTAFLVRRRLS